MHIPLNIVMDTIKTRRSIRSYSHREIPRGILEAIIDAGNWAPTGANMQPWRFVVVQDAAFRQKLSDIAIPKYWQWYEKAGEKWQEIVKPVNNIHDDPVYYDAPVIVFVIGKTIYTYHQDCAMVCQNMMLAAWSFGIGSCWVGFGQMALQDDEVKAALELQDNEKVFGPILLGYPGEDMVHPPEKKAPVITWI